MDKKAPIFLKDGVNRYLNITYVQVSENWYNIDNVYTETLIPAKHCEQSDFGNDKRSVNFFKSWAGFSLFCPQLENNNIMFYNKLGSMKSRHLKFEVSKCVNSTSNNFNCHSN